MKKTEKKVDLIIPEFEPYKKKPETKDDEPKTENKVDIDEVEKEISKKEKEETKSIEKTHTNTDEIFDFLDESINTLHELKMESKHLFGFKYRMHMYRFKGTPYVRKLIGWKDSKVFLFEAFGICESYLKLIHRKFEKLADKKRPFMNNQNFSSYKGITINGNEKLDFIEQATDSCIDILDDLLNYGIFDREINNDINALFKDLLAGLERVKVKGFARLTKMKRFSELTERLNKINYLEEIEED